MHHLPRGTVTLLFADMEGSTRHTVDSLFHLARVEVHHGDNMAARALYKESLAMAVRGGDSKGLIPSCLEALADVAVAQG
jgi:hypothetical protein